MTISVSMIFGFKRLVMSEAGISECVLGRADIPSPGHMFDLLRRDEWRRRRQGLRPHCPNCGAPYELADDTCSYCLSARPEP